MYPAIPSTNLLNHNMVTMNDNNKYTSPAAPMCYLPVTVPLASGQQNNTNNVNRSVNLSQSNDLWIENGNSSYVAPVTTAARRYIMNVQTTPSQSTATTFPPNYNQGAGARLIQSSNFFISSASQQQQTHLMNYARRNQTMETYQRSEVYVQSQPDFNVNASTDISYLGATNNGCVYSQL